MTQVLVMVRCNLLGLVHLEPNHSAFGSHRFSSMRERSQSECPIHGAGLQFFQRSTYNPQAYGPRLRHKEPNVAHTTPPGVSVSRTRP